MAKRDCIYSVEKKIQTEGDNFIMRLHCWLKDIFISDGFNLLILSIIFCGCLLIV